MLNKIFIPSVFLFFSGTLVCAIEKNDRKRVSTLRFLCVSPDLPSKFKRMPNGFHLPIPFDYDERPPAAVFFKYGEDYKVVPFLQGGVSAPFLLSFKKQTQGAGFYFQGDSSDALQSVIPRADGHSNEKSNPMPSPTHAKTGKSGPSWHLLADCPKEDGKDHLVCLFNPNLSVKWYPPKVLDLDISESVFPAGHCMAINLSAKYVYLQAGEGTPPLSLAPGGGFSITNIKTDGNGETRLKAAAVVNPKKPTIVFNRSMPVSLDSRSIIVLYEANPSMGIPVDVRFFQLPNDQKPVSLDVDSGAKKGLRGAGVK